MGNKCSDMIFSRHLVHNTTIWSSNYLVHVIWQREKNRNLDKFCPIFQGEGVKLGLIYCPNINILVLAMFKIVAYTFTTTI